MSVEPRPNSFVEQAASWAVTGGLVLGAVMLALLARTRITGLDASQAWFESPAAFPLAALALVGVSAAVHGWQRLLARRRRAIGSDAAGSAADDDEIDASATDPRRAIGCIAMLLLYPVAMAAVGFMAATFLFVLAVAALVKLPLRRAALVGGCMAGGLWLVFVWGFKLGLPEPWLFEMILGA